MKNNFKFIAAPFFSMAIFAILAIACTSGSVPNRSPNQSSSSQAAEKQVYKSVGVIKKVDAGGGKVTIDHEDIPGYMAAMEMTETVSDKKMLETIKAGDKVEFEVERNGSNLTIVNLTKIGEVASRNATEVYLTNCASCHGASGEGAPQGISLISGHALDHTEAEYIEQVTNGTGEKMPAFRDKLSAEEIKRAVDYVRRDLQKDAVREPVHHHQH